MGLWCASPEQASLTLAQALLHTGANLFGTHAEDVDSTSKADPHTTFSTGDRFLSSAGLSGRHRGIASLVFSHRGSASPRIFRSENVHRQDVCIASHRDFRVYHAPPLTSHRCPHRAIWATQALDLGRLVLTLRGCQTAQHGIKNFCRENGVWVRKSQFENVDR